MQLNMPPIANSREINTFNAQIEAVYAAKLHKKEGDYLCLNRFVFDLISPGLHVTRPKCNWLDLTLSWFRYSAKFYDPLGNFIPIIAIFCGYTEQGFLSVFLLTETPLMPSFPNQLTLSSSFEPSQLAVLKQITPSEFPFSSLHIGKITANQFTLLYAFKRHIKRKYFCFRV